MVAANVVYGAAELEAEGENVREQVDDIIHNIAPFDTPIQMKIGRKGCESDRFEWMIDDLAAATPDNAHLSGDAFGANVTGDTTTAPRRVWGFLQIFKKQLVIDRRAEHMSKHGRASEMAYQIAKKGKEIKRDIESSITEDQITVAESGATIARMAGIPAWIYTNDYMGAGGASPALSNTTWGAPTTARTAGTPAAPSEADILNGIRDAFIAGGNPTGIVLSPTQKQNLSNYLIGQSTTPRNAQPYQDLGAKPSGGATVTGAVGYYVSDFGTLTIYPERFMSNLHIFILDFEQWCMRYLDGIFVEKLGKDGDYERKHMIADAMLQSKQEAASALVTDLNTSAFTA